MLLSKLTCIHSHTRNTNVHAHSQHLPCLMTVRGLFCPVCFFSTARACFLSRSLLLALRVKVFSPFSLQCLHITSLTLLSSSSSSSSPSLYLCVFLTFYHNKVHRSNHHFVSAKANTNTIHLAQNQSEGRRKNVTNYHKVIVRETATHWNFLIDLDIKLTTNKIDYFMVAEQRSSLLGWTRVRVRVFG